MRRALALTLCAFATLGAQNSSPQLLGDVATGIPQLRRSIALNLTGVTLETALREIGRRSELPITYNDRILPKAKTVWLTRDDIRTDEALQEVLRGSGLSLLALSTGQVVVVRTPDPAVGTISGTVTEAKTGQAVGQAQIGVLGTSLTRTSDDRGHYSIAGVAAGLRTVTVKRLGYDPMSREVTVTDGGSVTADFQLTGATTRLAEIVTTVTGQQRRLELGNTIGRIAADSLVQSGSITNFSDVLNARVPGVQVLMPGGYTGTSASIRIRGINSISLSSNPLLVVDGARVINTETLLGAFSPRGGFGQTGGRLNDINPEEIESIEIVKGPSAATLYGTDAANGVIVIKTKRGSGVNSVPRWSAFTEQGSLSPAVKFRDNWYAWGHTPVGVIRQCPIEISVTGACVIDSVTTFNPLEDATFSPIGNGYKERYGLQLSGSTNRLTYFVSGEQEGEQGFLRMPASEKARVESERGGSAIPDEQLHPNTFNNVRLRANVGIPVGSTADISVSSGLVLNETNIPDFTVFRSGERGKGYRDSLASWGGARPGEAFAVRNKDNVTHLTTSLAANWRPLSWLSTRATTGVDFTNAFLDALQRRNEGPLGANRNGRRQNVRSLYALYSVDVGASALLPIRERLTSRTSVGVQYNRNKDQFNNVLGTGLPPGSETITGATTLSGSEQNLESVVAGAYVEQTMGWDERLFVTAGLRGDGGSTFGRNFKTATYPKLSASWLAIPNHMGAVDNLRLRVAYGASGVQPSSTAALTLDRVITVFTDGSTASGALPSTIGNPALKPERTSEFEGGFDAELFKGALSLELTRYSRRSHDALVQYLLPDEVGVTSQWRNLASVLNKGWEGLATIRPLNWSAAQLAITLNGSVNTNRVERLGFVQPLIETSSGFAEGYPLASRFWEPYTFSDANNNGIIESSEVTFGSTVTYGGTAVPPRQFTLTTALTLLHGQLHLSTQFDRRSGFVQENADDANRCLTNFNACREANDKTTPLWMQARRIATNTTFSLRGWWEDGSFTRWRELAIAADIPARFAEKARAKSATVTLAGRNLALFTKYSGNDPEVNVNSGRIGKDGYSDSSTAPPARYWLLRLNLGF
jgi:TonB-dependent SusC/RagA subfamily outer membrane receptor